MIPRGHGHRMSTVSAALPASVVPVAEPVAPTARRATLRERRLSRRLAHQDRRGVEELRERWGAGVMTYLVRTLPDRATAEDVFQQVFLEAWRRGDYDPTRSAPQTWLMLIARSRATDALRRWGRQPRPQDPDVVAVMSDVAVEPVEHEELMADASLADLLAALPDHEREVLRLRFAEGLEGPEVAARLGIAEGTVKSRTARALERLRASISEEEVR